MSKLDKYKSWFEEESYSTVIECSDKAIEKFGFAYGADAFCITTEELEQLKSGKILAMEINGREYVAFLKVKESEE